MKKYEYITPNINVRILHVEKNVLAGLSIVSGPADNSEVLSKDIDLDNEDVDDGSNVWED